MWERKQEQEWEGKGERVYILKQLETRGFYTGVHRRSTQKEYTGVHKRSTQKEYTEANMQTQ